MAVIQPSPTGPNAALVWQRAGKEYVYQLTDRDRADFYRCIWREGAPQRAVGWTLIQRFALLHPKPYATFGAFLRAYCQPINPRWFTSGKLHKAYHRRLVKIGDDRRAADELRRAQLREQYAVTPVEQIPSGFRQVVDRILSGRDVSPVPDAAHFSVARPPAGATEADAKRAAEDFADRKGFGRPVPVQGGWKGKINWFFRAPGNRRPPLVAVRPLPAETGPPGPPGPPGPDVPGPPDLAPGTALAALGALFLALSRKRR